jgi:hypothetical protein
MEKKYTPLEIKEHIRFIMKVHKMDIISSELDSILYELRDEYPNLSLFGFSYEFLIEYSQKWLKSHYSPFFGD